jgi:hypothetical protein
MNRFFGAPKDERGRWRRVVQYLDEYLPKWRLNDNFDFLGDRAIQAIAELVERTEPAYAFYVVKSTRTYVTYDRNSAAASSNAGYRNKQFPTLEEAKGFALEWATRFKGEYTVTGGKLLGKAGPSTPPAVWTDAT